MLNAKRYRVLFFINGPVPTPMQRAQAMTFGPDCTFRNVQHYNPDTAIEECDAVTGDVPEKYEHVAAAIPIGEWYASKLPQSEKIEPFVAPVPSPSDPFAVPAATSEPLDPFRPPTAPVAWAKNA